MKNHATPWEKTEKSKIDFRRSFSVLADLDINFVFEGRMWFLWDFKFLLPGRKPRFCIATAKVVEFLKVRLRRFFAAKNVRRAISEKSP